MISKILSLSVETLINLNLIKGYKLVPIPTLLRLEEDIHKAEAKLVELTEKTQTQEQDSYSYKSQWEEAKVTITKLNSDLAVKTKALNATESEVELARSDVLVHKEKMDEAEQLSKQLKEALERWTSY